MALTGAEKLNGTAEQIDFMKCLFWCLGNILLDVNPEQVAIIVENEQLREAVGIILTSETSLVGCTLTVVIKEIFCFCNVLLRRVISATHLYQNRLLKDFTTLFELKMVQRMIDTVFIQLNLKDYT